MKYWIDRGLIIMLVFYGLMSIVTFLSHRVAGVIVVIVGGIVVFGWYYITSEVWVDQVLSNLALHEQVQRIVNPDQFERWEDWAVYRPEGDERKPPWDQT